MNLEKQILQVMKGIHVAAVATVADGKPAVRFMALEGFDDLSLVGATMKGSRKVGQIKKTPDVALSIWSCGEFTDPYVVITATATLHEDYETKRRYWDPVKEQYFGTPDNPEYVVLRFLPERIEYYDQNGMAVWKKKSTILTAR